MEERTAGMAGEHQPVHAAGRVAATSDGSLADPRSLTILTTEHWSLLSARSLVYNEAFARAGMNLSFLSATLVALGLVATATGFSDGFLMIAGVLLAINLFIGYASLGRIASATAEDVRYLQAMNRIRHAYVEMSPGIAPYLLTGHHDDMATVLAVYGPMQTGLFRSIAHGFTTTAGMIGVINSVVGGALGAVVTMLLTHEPPLAAIVGAAASLALFALIVTVSQRMLGGFWARLEVMFPPDAERP